jgi:hypothetical protein
VDEHGLKDAYLLHSPGISASQSEGRESIYRCIHHFLALGKDLGNAQRN